MSGTARVIVEKKPRGRGEIKFRASVMVNEPYTSLRRILSFEDDLDVVRYALEMVQKAQDERKTRLLSLKAKRLEEQYSKAKG